MARKGWDALSDSYRKRLLKNGITRALYDAGASISGARGHASNEAFSKRVSYFLTVIDTPDDKRKKEKARIMAMGPQSGQAYMDYRRAMIRKYESGDYEEAQAMYEQRDKSVHGVMYRRRRQDNAIVDATWWYHGIFGG